MDATPGAKGKLSRWGGGLLRRLGGLNSLWLALGLAFGVAVLYGTMEGPQALRGWLDTNKVFFEVFAAVALGTMGVVLAYRGNRLAERQTELAERQTLIAEEQLRPRFRFAIEGDTGANGGTLTARNEGGPLFSYEFYHMAFLRLDLIPESGDELVVWVPYYYFTDRDLSQNSQGDLFRAFQNPDLAETAQRMCPAPRTWEEVWAFERRLRDDLPSHGFSLRSIELRHYVEVHYEWSLGRESDSFQVHPGTWYGLAAQRLKGTLVVNPNITSVTGVASSRALESPEALVKALPYLRQYVVPPPEY